VVTFVPLSARLRDIAPGKAWVAGACLVLFLVLVLLFAVIVVALPPWDSGDFNDPVEARIQATYREHMESHQKDAFAAVTISVRSVDPGGFTASTVVSIRFIDSTLADRKGRPVLGQAATLSDPDHEVSTRIVTDSGAVDVSIPLGDFDPATSGARAAVSIPVRGQPQYFPQDSYQLQAFSSVRLPADVFVLPAGRTAPLQPVRAFTAFKVGSGLAYWRARSVDDESAETTGDRSQNLASMELYRPPKFYGYVYAVVVGPLLFVIAYLLISTASTKARGATSHFEFGVAILAILTLREVFVPDGVASLTRLDHLLGLSVIGCVVIAAVIALVEYEATPRKGEEQAANLPSSTDGDPALGCSARRTVDGLVIVAALVLAWRATMRRRSMRR
jgi:hypothetical protein